MDSTIFPIRFTVSNIFLHGHHLIPFIHLFFLSSLVFPFFTCFSFLPPFWRCFLKGRLNRIVSLRRCIGRLRVLTAEHMSLLQSESLTILRAGSFRPRYDFDVLVGAGGLLFYEPVLSPLTHVKLSVPTVSSSKKFHRLSVHVKKSHLLSECLPSFFSCLSALSLLSFQSSV